jgi:hypothetical protein
VHLDIERSEVPEITDARSLSQEKVRSEILILPGSLYHFILTSKLLGVIWSAYSVYLMIWALFRRGLKGIGERKPKFPGAIREDRRAKA